MPAPTHLNITHLGSRRVTTTISKLIETALTSLQPRYLSNVHVVPPVSSQDKCNSTSEREFDQHWEFGINSDVELSSDSENSDAGFISPVAPQGEHHRVDSEEGSSAFSDSSSDKGEYGSSNESADATFHLAGQFFARDDDKFKVCRVTKSSNVFTVRAANISVGTYTVISFNGQGWVRL
ncbi:hypothetical protein F441_17239 [Phytophthora nicotianae CJ01A1]|uniref:Uncharacterized protein n=2 Tax=Phytophthora nicotianae TaxID=4792 RepID=W2W760_PHYNI|nr:hypothetical protein F441_17239 [Phytophthora nicotianae CJ01A1]